MKRRIFAKSFVMLFAFAVTSSTIVHSQANTAWGLPADIYWGQETPGILAYVESSGSNVVIQTNQNNTRSIQTLGQTVLDLAISPDGSQLLVAFANHSITMWDVLSGRQLLLSNEPALPTAFRAAWNVDGSLFVTAGSGGLVPSVHIWETSTMTIRFSANGATGITPIAWSKDGRLAVTRDIFMDIYDGDSGDLLQSIEIPGLTTMTEWSISGQYIAGVYLSYTEQGASSLIIWDVSSGEIATRFDGLRDVLVDLSQWS